MQELTDKKVAGWKPSAERQEVKDGKWPVYLVVQPSGVKSFQWRGRVDGKSARRTLGQYPDLSLANARTAALAIKSEKRSTGNVPPPQNAPEPKPEPVAPVADGITVSKAFNLYMKAEGDSRKTGAEKRRAFERDVEPVIGSRLMAEIDHDDLEAIIAEKFEDAPIMSNRLVSMLARFWKWAGTKGRKDTGLKTNAMATIVKLAEENVRDRWFTKQEIKWLFDSMSEANGCAKPFMMLAYTVLRRSDVFDLTWTMVDGDRLNIPETKNTLAHIVWLHPTAAALIPERPKDAKDDDLVFTDHAKSAYAKPLSRVRKTMTKLAEAVGKTVEHWVLHDLRTTATTHMASFLDENDRQKIPGNIRDRLLAHKDQSVRGRHYDRYDNYAEKKAALKLWGDFLDEIRAAK